MEIDKALMEDLYLHENHNLTIVYLKGMGIVLRCIDCDMVVADFENKEFMLPNGN